MYVNQVEGAQQKQTHPIPTREAVKPTPKTDTEKEPKIEEAAKVELSYQNRTDAEEQHASLKRTEEAKELMRKALPHSEVKYGVHEETNRIMIQIIDKETDELILEYPAEKELDRLAKTLEMAGNLLDEKL